MKLLIDNIFKDFKDFKAVNSVKIEFTPGIGGLLGPNGAGKTTLMGMLVGNIKPSNGKIMLDGVSIVELGDKYRDKIGYLPQQFNQSVKDFLHYIGALKGIKKDLRTERISELLNQFNLSDVSNKKIDKLSGG